MVAPVSFVADMTGHPHVRVTNELGFGGRPFSDWWARANVRAHVVSEILAWEIYKIGQSRMSHHDSMMRALLNDATKHQSRRCAGPRGWDRWSFKLHATAHLRWLERRPSTSMPLCWRCKGWAPENQGPWCSEECRQADQLLAGVP